MLNAKHDTLKTDASDLRWFAGQLKPNGLSLAELNLARQGIESFCPWMIETKRRDGKLQDLRRPLFPGYIFVRIDPKAGLWRTVNATRGLTRLVQTDPRAPTPLPNDLIAGLRARCSDKGELQTGPELSRGDYVRVVAGPFVDFVAQIEAIGEDTRVRVLFELMNRKVMTALDPSMLRKLE